MASLQLPATSYLAGRSSSSFSDQSHILFYSKSSSSSFFPYQSSVSRFRPASISPSPLSSLHHGPLHSSSFSPIRASSCLISDTCPIDNDQESILHELAELKDQMKQKKKQLKALAKKEEKNKKSEKKLLSKKAKTRDCESSSSSLSDVECCDQSVDMKELKKGLGFAESMAETEEVLSVEDPEGRVVERMEEKACKAEIKMLKEKSKSENKKLMKEKAKSDKKKLAMQKMEGTNDCESSSSSSSSESSDDEEDCCDQILDMKDLKLGLVFAETMTGAEEVIASVESMETTIKAVAEPLPFSIESMEIRKALSSCITEPMEPTKAPPASTEFMETAENSPFSQETMGTAKKLLSCTESIDRKNEFSSSVEPSGKTFSSCVNESIGTSKASLSCVIADESVKNSFPSCKSMGTSKTSISCIAAEESMESARLTGKIQVCVGGKCKKAGSEKLMASLRSRIPGDSGVEAVPCKCMGKCAMAINVKVQKLDEETRNLTQRHSYVGVDDADLILRHHFGGVNEIPPRLLSLSSPSP